VPFAKLKRIEPREKATPCQKFPYRPALDHSSSVEHDHFVRVFDSADAVGDDQYGSITAELLESILDHRFRDEIERVCRLIQNQDLWISYKGAG